ncbi:hypothetical protein Q7C36_023203 [Tachysurus vachellii]|uniref:Uncharacterized protein n=1 Tax=Tachysurus vachellii TaxID=175792 RepID=A0AA88IZZ7_TACVA|nr:hypothetical protein Q7C36_023203 [Tachysurus vachellii]
MVVGNFLGNANVGSAEGEALRQCFFNTSSVSGIGQDIYLFWTLGGHFCSLFLCHVSLFLFFVSRVSAPSFPCPFPPLLTCSLCFNYCHPCLYRLSYVCLSLIPCLLVCCFWFAVSLFVVPVYLRFLFPVSSLQSPISSLLSPVSYLQSPLSSLLSPVSYLQSPLSSLLSPVSYLQSPISSLLVFLGLCYLSLNKSPFMLSLHLESVPSVAA